MRRIHLFAALAFALVFPAKAYAVTVRPPEAPTPPPNGTVTYTYRTFLAPEPIAGGGPVGDLNEDFGTLQLTFNANGIISGTYHPDYGPPIPVTGGRTDPQHLWLELGTAGRIRLTGQFTSRGFVASSPVDPSGAVWRLFAIYEHA